MRIDLVITELDDGGAERCCSELALFLMKRGHEVRLIVIGPVPNPPRDQLYLRLVREGVRMEFVGARKWYQFPFALWKLRRLVARDKPQIAQSFLWHANVLSAAVFPRFKIPLVGGHRVAEHRDARNAWSRWAANRMHRVVCVSDSLAEWCTNAEKIPLSNFVVIPNGVDLEQLDRNATIELREESCVPTLLFVGRLHYQKGIDVLMEHSKSILTQLPQHHLVIIGYGPLRSQVDIWRQELSMKDRVHVLGQRPDVAAWMKQSQLLVLPSRFEGMPNAVLEAMGLGIPVATMRVEGVSELLGTSTDTQSVPRDDWRGWQELVVELGKSPDRCKELGEANRKRVRECFQLADQLRKYEMLYQQVLSETQSRRSASVSKETTAS